MAAQIAQFQLSSPDATAKLARAFGQFVRPGDILLLEGDIGAGKTHFARCLIQSLQDDAPEDVPSPTFTLVQSYETTIGQVVHADLYRLVHATEVAELGLIDAFEEAVCLIEWPDRLGPDTPNQALTLVFQTGDTDDARRITAFGNKAIWTPRLPEATCV